MKSLFLIFILLCEDSICDPHQESTVCISCFATKLWKTVAKQLLFTLFNRVN